VQAQLAKTAKSVESLFKGFNGAPLVIETKFDGPPPYPSTLHPNRPTPPPALFWSTDLCHRANRQQNNAHHPLSLGFLCFCSSGICWFVPARTPIRAALW